MSRARLVVRRDAPPDRAPEQAPRQIEGGPAAPRAPVPVPIFGHFIVHVDAPTIIKNRDTGSFDPVVLVRRADDLSNPLFFREVYWNSPTKLVHKANMPLPGTNGRGVAWMETDGPLTCIKDGEKPVVLFAPGQGAGVR